MQPNRRLCRAARERIGRAFDGSLSVEERFAMEEHAADCERCAAELSRVQLLSEALLRMPEAPVGGLDVEAAVLAVRARIDEQESATRPTGVLRLAAGWAAAAALVIGFAWWNGREDVPSVPTHGTELALVPEPEVGIEEETDAETDAEVDAQRRAEVLASVRGLLDVSLAAQDPEAAKAAWTVEFLERSGKELGAGWPLEGLLRELTEDEDARIASAALRGLGAVGGRMAVANVERSLAVPGRRRAAAQALVDLGATGERALARAWWRSEVRELVQGRLLERAADGRRNFVQEALRVGSRDARDASADLAELLFDSGEQGLRELIELGGSGDFEQAALVAVVAREDDKLAAQVILELADERGNAGMQPFLLAAAGALQGQRLLDWVMDRAERGGHRELVAGALAMFDAPRARAGLMLLEASRRVEPEAFLEAWRVAVKRNPDGMREYAEGLGLDRGTAARLLELCVASEEAAALGAGFSLCGAQVLPTAERRDALLALGEQCGEAQLVELEQLFAQLNDGDAPVAAALVLVVHRIGGETASARLLGDLPPEVLDR
ncbi:MAG: hypothetical protein ACI8QC_003649, partial [Planctomycetota bacterium]